MQQLVQDHATCHVCVRPLTTGTARISDGRSGLQYQSVFRMPAAAVRQSDQSDDQLDRRVFMQNNKLRTKPNYIYITLQRGAPRHLGFLGAGTFGGAAAEICCCCCCCC
jgi:hypothetical protein